MSNEENNYNNVLRDIYMALDAVRTQIRELEKEGGENSKDLAVLASKMESVEKQLETLWAQHSQVRITAAEKSGGDKVKWAILGAIGGAIIAAVIAQAIGVI